MELQVRPAQVNAFPLNGLLLRGEQAADWLAQLQLMGINPEDGDCYALPGAQANSVSGCLLIRRGKTPVNGSYVLYQSIEDRIFIPAFSALFPALNKEELLQLFPKDIHVFQPGYGWAQLEAPLNWASLLEVNIKDGTSVTAPKAGPFVPQYIRSLEIHALPPDETLEQMATENFPTGKRMEETPLTLIEKLKLWLFRKLFNKHHTAYGEPRQPSLPGKALQAIARLLSNKPENWADHMEQDYEELERRNQNEMDKLMQLFKDNPEEALMYAIPLAATGAGRGGNFFGFSLQQRWSNFSLSGMGGVGYGSGTGIISAGSYERLSDQYQKTARELIAKGDYAKAAFVYLKLLKNELLAAETLEQGGLYAEAAALYLTYDNTKKRAAACYLKGNMLSKAIALYDELGDYEKAGDIAMQLGKKDDAFAYYGKVIDSHRQFDRYVMAALVYRNKMNDRHAAQSLLKEGWIKGHDAYNCLNNYFENIEDVAVLRKEIDAFYEAGIEPEKTAHFLQALKQEHVKHAALSGRIREIAYELVAAQSDDNPGVAAHLQLFNNDPVLSKDILRFRSRAK